MQSWAFSHNSIIGIFTESQLLFLSLAIQNGGAFFYIRVQKEMINIQGF